MKKRKGPKAKPGGITVTTTTTMMMMPNTVSSALIAL